MKRNYGAWRAPLLEGVLNWRFLGTGCGLIVLVAMAGAAIVDASDYDALRQVMMEEIAQDVRLTRGALGKDALDEDVMSAIGRVPIPMRVGHKLCKISRGLRQVRIPLQVSQVAVFPDAIDRLDDSI